MNRTKKVFKGHGWDRAILFPVIGVASLVGVALASAPLSVEAASAHNQIHSMGGSWGGSKVVHTSGGSWGGSKVVHPSGGSWGGSRIVHPSGGSWGGN